MGESVRRREGFNTGGNKSRSGRGRSYGRARDNKHVLGVIKLFGMRGRGRNGDRLGSRGDTGRPLRASLILRIIGFTCPRVPLSQIQLQLLT